MVFEPLVRFNGQVDDDDEATVVTGPANTKDHQAYYMSSWGTELLYWGRRYGYGPAWTWRQASMLHQRLHTTTTTPTTTMTTPC